MPQRPKLIIPMQDVSHHLRHFFGDWSYFELEWKCFSYFVDNSFPPSIDKKVLEDKMVKLLLFKRPDLLLELTFKND